MHAKNIEKYHRLPYDILKAIHRAMHLVDIKRCAKVTLAEICRHVSISNPDKPIYPSKDTIAKEIQMSPRSVFRHIAYLSEAGFIEVITQERLRGSGWYTNGQIKITEKTKLLLELDKESIANNKNYKSIYAQPSDKKAGAKLTDVNHTKGQPTTPTKDDFTKGIPTPLAWLVDTKLSRGGVCKLMGMATKKGKRLEDILTVEEETVCSLEGKILFGFFRKRIENEIDYAYIARLKREKDEAIHQIGISRQKSIAVENALKGKTLINKDHDELFEVDATTSTIFFNKKGFTGNDPYPNFIAIEKLISTGKLIIATEDEIQQTKANISFLKAPIKKLNISQPKRTTDINNIGITNAHELLADQIMQPVKTGSSIRLSDAIKALPTDYKGNIKLIASMLKINVNRGFS